MQVSHLLYSGLGGHGNVFFSLHEAEKNTNTKFNAIFYGIEEVRGEYKSRCERNNIPFIGVTKKRGFDLLFFYKIYKAIQKQKPDLIFLHGSYLIFPVWVYSLFYSTKIIVRETQANHLKTKVEWLNLIISFVLSNKLFLLSEQYALELKRTLHFFYNEDKVRVIPNGLNLNKFTPKLKKKLQKPLKVGMVSRLVNIKDHKTLIKAMVSVNDNAELFIAGDGEAMPELQNLCRELKISNVNFIGVLNEYQLVDFYQSLDIYVHASYGETMSTSIMQAQACGLPIIASDVKGINNVIISNENGVLVELESVEDLTNKLLFLIQNEGLRVILSLASRKYAEKHLSNETMFDLYQKAFME